MRMNEVSITFAFEDRTTSEYDHEKATIVDI